MPLCPWSLLILIVTLWGIIVCLNAGINITCYAVVNRHRNSKLLSVKDQGVDILGFVGHVVSFATAVPRQPRWLAHEWEGACSHGTLFMDTSWKSSHFHRSWNIVLLLIQPLKMWKPLLACGQTGGGPEWPVCGPSCANPGLEQRLLEFGRTFEELWFHRFSSAGERITRWLQKAVVRHSKLV